MAGPSEKELLELGRKAFERKIVDAKRTQAHGKAVAELIKLHQEQFNKLFEASKKEAGL